MFWRQARWAMGKMGLGIGCLLLMLSGCAMWDRMFHEEEKPPEILMTEAQRDLQRGYYQSATEAFQKIIDRYPYSPFVVEAELKKADALYERGLYDEAFDAYRNFERLHPKNPDVPYTMYRQGMCQFEQISTIDRDPAYSANAKDEFERLVKRFPKSEYAARATPRIRECYSHLARHELYVGHFYFGQKRYRAAMERYLYLLENYPDMGQYQEALDYLSRCKERLAAAEPPLMTDPQAME